MNEPLDPTTTRRLIRQSIAEGRVRFSGHALRQMEAREISRTDVYHVLTAGVVGEAEWESGSWRYPVQAYRIRVVVAFDDETVVIVVTAIRT